MSTSLSLLSSDFTESIEDEREIGRILQSVDEENIEEEIDELLGPDKMQVSTNEERSFPKASFIFSIDLI